MANVMQCGAAKYIEAVDAIGPHNLGGGAPVVAQESGPSSPRRRAEATAEE